ncbi:NAD(P)(+) transhydrogenase (Re/Si-specific) subunit beta [Pelagibacteraceae bacterium]|jgi:H+-translocating NAD(P) transhydrogenase subunit beta|nr:NAD(P)(+) transhydrogenase (Re/Si-specific) subunit beta [Pelagibacteraceae bacterium]
MSANLSSILFLITGVLFILALRGLSSPETSRLGNFFGIAGMVLAIIVSILSVDILFTNLIYFIIALSIGGIIGGIIAFRIPMTAMPQLVAGFHSLVGLAAVLVAVSAYYSPDSFGLGTFQNIKTASIIEMGLGVSIGAITFTGSIIAFMKLQGLMSGSPITFTGQHYLNAILGISILSLIFYLIVNQSSQIFWILIIASLLIGFLIIIPIGGADMPVVISMLNSYSGWAAAGIGFTLENTALIITGALVGSSGAILSYIMCKGMNRSFLNVILGGFGTDSSSNVSKEKGKQKPVKSGNAEDAAFLMKNASSVIIVPGYGMAVAQAQHALREMVDKLKKNDVKVSYAIHPVAGRMPGHMNVLLAEANVPYDEVFELDDINNDFGNTDVAYVIGANDVTNPVAKTDPKSPIFGMPILDVEKCKSVLFVKRGMSPGYAGVDNELFYRDNTLMLFADAKKMTEDIVKNLD